MSAQLHHFHSFLKAVNLKLSLVEYCFCPALVFSYDFHAGAETMYSRHFNDPAADSYFTKRKWGELSVSSLPLLRGNRPCTMSIRPQTFAHFYIVFFFLLFGKHYSHKLRLQPFFVSHGCVKRRLRSMFLHPRSLARAKCLGWMF